MTTSMAASAATRTLSAEEKWREGGMNPKIRLEMLRAVNSSESFAKLSWSKLPYILKTNLSSKTWS